MYTASTWQHLPRRRVSLSDRLLYNAATNEFAVVTSQGVLRTYFKPQEGIAYWMDQVAKLAQ